MVRWCDRTSPRTDPATSARVVSTTVARVIVSVAPSASPGVALPPVVVTLQDGFGGAVLSQSFVVRVSTTDASSDAKLIGQVVAGSLEGEHLVVHCDARHDCVD